MPQLEFRTGTLLLDGPVGAMELRIDAPAEPARGIAIVAHPHPLLGGSAMHKVPHLLAGALRDASWLAVRPNFRGVGASPGSHGGRRIPRPTAISITAHCSFIRPTALLVSRP